MTKLEQDLIAALADLLAAFVNPYDGSEFEDGEVPAVDLARAVLKSAIAGTRRQPKVSAMAGPIPDDPDTLLTRVDCAAVLTAAGFPMSPKTLATKASRGGGPPFRRWGPKPLYQWGTSLSWARARLGPQIHSTSEVNAVGAENDDTDS